MVGLGGQHCQIRPSAGIHPVGRIEHSLRPFLLSNICMVIHTLLDDKKDVKLPFHSQRVTQIQQDSYDTENSYPLQCVQESSSEHTDVGFAAVCKATQHLLISIISKTSSPMLVYMCHTITAAMTLTFGLVNERDNKERRVH